MPHRLLGPEGCRAHEYIALHRQLGDLLAQVVDLTADALAQRALATLSTLIRPRRLAVSALVQARRASHWGSPRRGGPGGRRPGAGWRAPPAALRAPAAGGGAPAAGCPPPPSCRCGNEPPRQSPAVPRSQSTYLGFRQTGKGEFRQC